MVSPLFGLDTGIPLSSLESVISLFRGLIKSALKVLQTAGGEGLCFMALRDMLVVHS